MTPPQSPLTDDVREWIKYAAALKTRSGFMRAYADTYASIFHSRRVGQRRGLKKIAYEAVEKTYEEIFQEGPKYLDIETFRNAYSQFCKNPAVKD